MFWVFMLSLFGSAAVYINRERHRELIPYVVAIIAVVQMFFLLPDGGAQQPVRDLPHGERRPTAHGLNPLLQNFYMVIHPPTMYLGFVGLTIPYAFGMAALITGHLDDSWLRAVRRWTMMSWLFLTFGLMLGMIWAYEELGWGGYWGWDPVENAALLPWFTATAFLHSVMRAGAARHAAGLERHAHHHHVLPDHLRHLHDPLGRRAVGARLRRRPGAGAACSPSSWSTILVVSFGLVIYRLPLLKARNELDSWVSREAAFLANNWILLFAAMFVLFATMFPTLSEAVTGERLTVGPPFFNKWMLPIGLVLLLLTGIGPLLAWRKSTLVNLRDQFLFPVVFGLVVGGSVVALGVRVWTLGHLLRAVRDSWSARSVRSSGAARACGRASPAPTCSPRSSAWSSRNKRRYGGYIVHVGIVLIFLGFAGEGFKQEEQALLKPGQQARGRRLHRAPRRAEGHRRRRKADGHGAPDRVPRRRGRRQDVSGASGTSASTRRSRPPRSPSVVASPRTSTS